MLIECREAQRWPKPVFGTGAENGAPAWGTNTRNVLNLMVVALSLRYQP